MDPFLMDVGGYLTKYSKYSTVNGMPLDMEYDTQNRTKTVSHSEVRIYDPYPSEGTSRIFSDKWRGSSRQMKCNNGYVLALQFKATYDIPFSKDNKVIFLYFLTNDQTSETITFDRSGDFDFFWDKQTGLVTVFPGADKSVTYNVKPLTSNGPLFSPRYYDIKQESLDYYRNFNGSSEPFSSIIPIFGRTTSSSSTDFSLLNSEVPVFDCNDIDSVKKYIKDGDTSGALYTGKKGTDWTVYEEFLKNNTIFTFKWKSDYIDYLLKDKMPVKAIKTIIEGHRLGDIGDWVKVKTLEYDVKYTTNLHELMKIIAPKYYQNLVNGNIFTTPPILELRFKNFSIDGSGRVNTNYGYFQIVVNQLNKWYIQEAKILPDDNPDESTITIVEGSGEEEDEYTPVPDDSDVGQDTGSGGGSSSLALLTHTYAMTEGRLKALGGFLWGDLLTNLKLVNNNPIENVVSCKIIPASVSGPDTAVYLGNVDTGVVGGLVSNNLKLTLGTINVSGYYHNFLDYAPYTKITIFIPFIGFKELDTSLFMGKSLKVEYIIDLITGACKALLFANDIYCQSFDGVCGIDIPLTSNNRAQVEASYVMGALGTAVSAATGNVAGVATSMLMSAMTPFHYSTKGTYSPSCGSFETRLCYLVIDRPTFQYPNTYAHDKGLPCQLSRSLGSLSGFTVCDGSVDLSGISCTEAEKEMLRKELTAGVYL